MSSGLAMLSWVFSGVLLILVLICVAADRGSLTLNRAVGIRLPAVIRNETTWRAGHAAAVVPAAVAFTVGLACSIVGLLVSWAYVGGVAALIVGFIWAIAAAVRAANAASGS